MAALETPLSRIIRSNDNINTRIANASAALMLSCPKVQESLSSPHTDQTEGLHKTIFMSLLLSACEEWTVCQRYSQNPNTQKVKHER